MASLLPILGRIDHGVLLLALAILCLFGLPLLWLVLQHLRHRRQGLARERALLAAPLPEDDALPRLLVQIPTYNEPKVVARVIEAVGSLDWPRDRFCLQVLDDSTDGSTAVAAAALRRLEARGVTATLLHRTSRTGFKAGALRDGLAQSDADYVAIFDADFVPPADFLRRSIRPLLRDPGLAFVQARFDYLNGTANAITRTQQRLLDAEMGVLQPARNWCGYTLPFSGTCGLWRRAAIDDAGGWQDDTLVEDVDLSYRAQLRGWRGLLLNTVTVPGELPDSFAAWQAQQFRWSKGYGELVRKHLPAIWRGPFRVSRKLIETALLGNCGLSLVLVLALATGAIDILVGPGITGTVLALAALAIVEAVVGALAVILIGQRVLRGADLRHEALAIPGVIWFFVSVGLANLNAVVEAARGKVSAFVRTPKKGGDKGASLPLSNK